MSPTELAAAAPPIDPATLTNRPRIANVGVTLACGHEVVYLLEEDFLVEAHATEPATLRCPDGCADGGALAVLSITYGEPR